MFWLCIVSVCVCACWCSVWWWPRPPPCMYCEPSIEQQCRKITTAISKWRNCPCVLQKSARANGARVLQKSPQKEHVYSKNRREWSTRAPFAPIHLWAPRANNTIIMLNSRKGGLATSSATPLCSQQAVLHCCAFAKTLHNVKAFVYFSLYRPPQVSCIGPDHATTKARSAWGAASAPDGNKQCYTAVLATSSATPLCFCQNITQHEGKC
jgi:hypothetical protein